MLKVCTFFIFYLKKRNITEFRLLFIVPKKLIEKLISQNSIIHSNLGNILVEQRKILDRISSLEKKLDDLKKDDEQDFLKVRIK